MLDCIWYQSFELDEFDATNVWYLELFSWRLIGTYFMNCRNTNETAKWHSYNDCESINLYSYAFARVSVCMQRCLFTPSTVEFEALWTHSQNDTDYLLYRRISYLFFGLHSICCFHQSYDGPVTSTYYVSCITAMNTYLYNTRMNWNPTRIG